LKRNAVEGGNLFERTRKKPGLGIGKKKQLMAGQGEMGKLNEKADTRECGRKTKPERKTNKTFLNARCKYDKGGKKKGGWQI